MSYITKETGRFTHLGPSRDKTLEGTLNVELEKDETLLASMVISLDGHKTDGNVGNYNNFTISKGPHRKNYRSVIKYGLWQNHWENFILQLKVVYDGKSYI